MNKKINEINIFSVGSSKDINVFSGVPYFFTKNVEEIGIKVNRIDISPPNELLSKCYDMTITKLISFIVKIIFKTENYYSYSRSSINYYFTNKKIIKAIAKYPDSEYNIFLTYSFSSYKFSKTPVILFCDATFENAINYLSDRKPNLLEKRTVKREIENIKKANFVFAFFPELKKEIENKYKKNNVYYLGKVINNVNVNEDLNEKEIIKEKLEKTDLLFIGRKHYQQGCEILINAFEKLNQNIKEKFHLNIIGLNYEDIITKNKTNKNVHFYGLLKKDNPVELQTYTSLIKSARLFINPQPLGGTFLTSIEVMYYFTPIIIVPYKEFLSVFEENATRGGIMLENTTSENLAIQIEQILQNNEMWKFYAKNAHETVKSFTWESLVVKMFNIIDN